MYRDDEADLLGVYCNRRDKGHSEQYAHEITKKYMLNFFITHMNEIFFTDKMEAKENLSEEDRERLNHIKQADDTEKLRMVEKLYADYRDIVFSSIELFERAYQHRNDILGR
ncbi:hypothetical protein PP175_22110 [Aneurinibacillus sp. Ricciae_BoGa-3]|uniref:hypothetical protein n=1 Tax=Aneurinibacillus sp. Ricciae_BoGa-3 TaxID=3022697 RepID=UPI0023418610|nr:hypothetical protein [Aneurinibacillus sp. Ricciae_BoGa-3]WCK53985.1 hypothetical protein PP175_22110 [Aneurinibacillus sp. Ricciae_BoGa-3]